MNMKSVSSSQKAFLARYKNTLMYSNPTTWLVTVALGSIGMHTNLRPLACDTKVIWLDNLDEDVALKQAHLAQLQPGANFTFQELV